MEDWGLVIPLTIHHLSRFHTKSGMANRSISVVASGDGMQGSVFLDDRIAKYTRFQHEGTGEYGPFHKPFTVEPKSRKSLYWVEGGGKHFAKKVTIKGIHPDQFLYRAFEAQRPYLLARMRGAVEAALQVSGLKGAK